MSARYFFHLTYDEPTNRYLINLVIAAAALELRDIDDDDLLESLDAGAHDTTTHNPVNTRTLDLFYDLLDAYLEDQTLNRPLYATL